MASMCHSNNPNVCWFTHSRFIDLMKQQHNGQRKKALCGKRVQVHQHWAITKCKGKKVAGDWLRTLYIFSQYIRCMFGYFFCSIISKTSFIDSMWANGLYRSISKTCCYKFYTSLYYFRKNGLLPIISIAKACAINNDESHELVFISKYFKYLSSILLFYCECHSNSCARLFLF